LRLKFKELHPTDIKILSTEHYNKIYTKLEQKKNSEKWKEYRKQYRATHKEQIKAQNHKRSKIYKLKLELDNAPISDDFYDDNLIFDF
jgi:hypothetical protein